MKLNYCVGEVGRTILDSIERTSGWGDVTFIDNNESLQRAPVDGTPVLGGRGELLAKMDSSSPVRRGHGGEQNSSRM